MRIIAVYKENHTLRPSIACACGAARPVCRLPAQLARPQAAHPSEPSLPGEAIVIVKKVHLEQFCCPPGKVVMETTHKRIKHPTRESNNRQENQTTHKRIKQPTQQYEPIVKGKELLNSLRAH